MTVLDANGLIYCLDNDKPLPEPPLIVTDELMEEYETALVVNGHRELSLEHISELTGYDEAFYLREYAKYLNSFSGVDLSNMRGVADASILALTSCVLEDFGGADQTQLDLGDITRPEIIVITNDDVLKRRLIRDFNNKVNVIDPSTL